MKVSRKWIVIGAIALAAVVAGLGVISAMGSKPAKGGESKQASKNSAAAPGFGARDIFDKEDVILQRYQGKVVLVNFWATWCPPCKAEIPDLVKLVDEYKGQFVVIGVSLDDSVEVVKPFVKKMEINYPVIMGTPEMVENYGGIQGIPTSFLLDKKGNVVQKIVGFRDYDQFKEAIEPLLKK